MAVVNILTLPDIFALPRAGCECVCERADTHVPMVRIPVVSARWTVETNGDGSRRLVEHWCVNQQTQNHAAPSKPGSSGAGSITAPGDRDHVPAVAKGGRY
jgi:hypothetical protein